MQQSHGEKAKLITALDNDAAESAALRPLYSIEISLERSPEKKVLCGAITVFRLNNIELGTGMEKILKATGPAVQKAIKEAHDIANEQTEVMYQDPILFRETDGQWVAWAIERALRFYDQFGGNAKIVIKSSKLRIREERTKQEVAAKRNEPRNLFKVAWDMSELLKKGFSWDPWTKTIRRGRISAEMSKR